MTYAYVQSATDGGRARGPRLAVLWHMAEGGGTVGFLSRPNIRSVSVHFVIEYTGRVVQMLQLDHMHTSVNPNDIRNTNDAYPLPVPYGRGVALDVLGTWADIDHGTLGPNHATIAVEMEGFAADGPNTYQSTSMGTLAAYLGIPANLAHRDFQDYKPCPGKRIPWAVVGGHGHTQAPEDDMTPLPITDQTPMLVTFQQPATFYKQDGTVESAGHTIPGTFTSPFQASNGTNHFRAVYAGPPPVRLILIKPATIDPLPGPGAATYTVEVGGKPAGTVTLP